MCAYSARQGSARQGGVPGEGRDPAGASPLAAGEAGAGPSSLPVEPPDVPAVQFDRALGAEQAHEHEHALARALAFEQRKLVLECAAGSAKRRAA
jgi:hypothetical protein